MATLRDPDVRKAFLDAVAETGFLNRAAARVGLTYRAVQEFRARNSVFAAEVEAAMDRRSPDAPRRLKRCTAARRAAFLAVLAETGQVSKAAAASGLSAKTAANLRQRDATFAAGWATARNLALDLIEERLFAAALDGFTRTETSDGKVRTIVTQNAGAMFKLIGARAKEGSRYRTIELTPQLVEDAHERVERRVRVAVEEARAQALLPAPRAAADAA